MKIDQSERVELGSSSVRVDEGVVNNDSAQKVKLMPVSMRKDIQQKNIARKLAGLPEIKITVRRCIACGSLFESAGNRICGCTSRTASIIGGREII